MAHVRPSSVDTRIALKRIAAHDAGCLADRRTDLASVRDVTSLWGVSQRAVLSSATGHAGSIGRCALNTTESFSPDNYRRAVNIARDDRAIGKRISAGTGGDGN